jgi:hypothetical protein
MGVLFAVDEDRKKLRGRKKGRRNAIRRENRLNGESKEEKWRKRRPKITPKDYSAIADRVWGVSR